MLDASLAPAESLKDEREREDWSDHVPSSSPRALAVSPGWFHVSFRQQKQNELINKGLVCLFACLFCLFVDSEFVIFLHGLIDVAFSPRRAGDRAGLSCSLHLPLKA